MFLTVIQEGRYTYLYLKRLGANAPTFTPEELYITENGCSATDTIASDGEV
jgi:hypothetical protein